jgi:hypothetical protein
LKKSLTLSLQPAKNQRNNKQKFFTKNLKINSEIFGEIKKAVTFATPNENGMAETPKDL